MNVRAKARLTVEEFFAWSATQDDGRAELVDGEIVVMAAETVRHNQLKLRAAIALGDAIRAAGLGCSVFGDGVAVRTGEQTCRIPDASVQCGPVDPESMELTDPVIVVEVVSLSSGRSDTGAKVGEYFRVPSIRHYLIIDPFGGRLILHSRADASATIATTVVTQGPVRFDPPGFTVLAEDLLGTAGEG
jgi:Uma2 family endonuclease